MGQHLTDFNWYVGNYSQFLVSYDVFKRNIRLYSVSLMLHSHRLDPESHREGTPRAIELAAINGHVDAFSLLAARLKMDSQNNEWFQLGKVPLLSSNHLLSLSVLSSLLLSSLAIVIVVSGDSWERSLLIQSRALLQLLVLGVAGKDEEFKELLEKVPQDKVEL